MGQANPVGEVPGQHQGHPARDAPVPAEGRRRVLFGLLLPERAGPGGQLRRGVHSIRHGRPGGGGDRHERRDQVQVPGPVNARR